MDWIIQKSVELGVSRIVPVMTRYSVVQLNDADSHKKTERWMRIAREAAKQCKRALVPGVDNPVTFEDAIIMSQSVDTGIVLYENEQKKCLKELLKCYTIDGIGSIALFIGSEGGFSENEIDLCIKSGFISVGLGKRILRAETAAISVLSILMYEMGELN